MTDPNLDPQEGENADSEAAAPTHIEVAPPASDDAPPPAQPPQAGPRTLPQHFSLLFANFVVFVGAISVWEREHVFGMEIEGPEMLSGAFLLALGGYATIVSILNIMQGRLRGMMATLSVCFFALYFGFPAMKATYEHPAFLTSDEVADYRMPENDAAPQIPDRFTSDETLEFPSEALDAMPQTWQTPYKFMLGQYAPGPLLTVFGGLLIAWVFLKGIFGGKKKEPTPAPSAARGGRRRR